jgi:RNA-directed DNA polymerase
VLRYADDSVVGFEKEGTARAFLADLQERLTKFGLSLHPNKTRMIEFGRYATERRRKRGRAGRKRSTSWGSLTVVGPTNKGSSRSCD